MCPPITPEPPQVSREVLARVLPPARPPDAAIAHNLASRIRDPGLHMLREGMGRSTLADVGKGISLSVLQLTVESLKMVAWVTSVVPAAAVYYKKPLLIPLAFALGFASLKAAEALDNIADRLNDQPRGPLPPELRGLLE